MNRSAGGRRDDRSTGVHLADAVIALIRNKQIARTVQRYTCGIAQPCDRSRPAVAQKGTDTVTGHGGDRSAAVHLADALIALIRNEQIAGTVQRYSEGIPQACARSRPAVTAKSGHTVTAHRGDCSAAVHLADAAIALIRDKQIARTVQHHPGGIRQACARSRPAVAAKVKWAVTRHRGDRSAAVHLADWLLAKSAINRLPAPSSATLWGSHNLCDRSRAAVARKVTESITRYRGDCSAAVHLADAVIAPIRDKQIARAVQRYPPRLAQRSRS